MNRAQEIANNLSIVRENISHAAQRCGRNLDQLTLITVTKTFPKEDLSILYELGLREFGENRDQEASAKASQLAKDINWHFQGGIQSNKLKSICSWASVIHSVDQYRYAQKISEYSANKGMKIFIQVSLDNPVESRGGVDPNKLIDLAGDISNLPNISIMGLMAVGPVDQPTEPAFVRLQQIHQSFLAHYKDAKYLSAGMSGDYEMAIAYGATHLRIGSSILGNRAAIK
jgi:pyridoxal phosphate enzyme (YggS family)